MDPAGDQARSILGLWNLMLWVCGFMYALVLAFLGIAVRKARSGASRSSVAGAEPRVHGLLIGWTVLFATSLVGGALGALMTFAQSPWYSHYASLGRTPFGLSASEDQQLAGLLMWIPGGLVHAGAALLMFLKVLGAAPDAERAPSAVSRVRL